MMSSIRAQRGQAMIFGLLFMAVVVMSMLILFNQGQLVKSRVQLENAADAAAYSQAKLAARNMNFVAYTNRAMVANEVSIGQMVSLLSWAKHYGNVGAFVNYPAYKFPVAPPSPTTFSDVLSVVTLPWQVMGQSVEAPAKVMTDVWPPAISYFNSGLGVFQKLFSFATLMAQFEVNTKVVQGHNDPGKEELYIPPIGLYFAAQNALLTYQGSQFSSAPANDLLGMVTDAEIGDADPEGLVADFLGGQTDLSDLHNLYETNTPNVNKAGEASVESYQRYAAIVNLNREEFTRDRHWDIWASQDFDFGVSLNFGIVKLTIELNLTVGAGLKNDGGSAFVAETQISGNADIAKLGWSAIDVTSFGINFDVYVFIEIEICIFGCSSASVDFGFKIPLGFPLAGATHQVVAKPSSNAKNNLFQWDSIGDKDGIYGGDPDDDENDGPFDAFHAQALLWGQAAPSLLPGMYGANTADVTTSYGGPPGFMSLGRNFQETGITYEYTVPVAKKLDDINTTDNEDSFNIGEDSSYDPDQWDDQPGDIGLTRFDVDTFSRAEADDVAGNYQQVVWGDDKPMMTLSAAEAYFSNPMQTLDDGSNEPASLFSPFWDARLKEPSAVSLLIATGEVDWDDLFSGLPSDAVAIVGWLMDMMVEKVVDESIDYLKDQIDSPYDVVLEDPLDAAGDAVKDAALDVTDDITDEMLEFID